MNKTHDVAVLFIIFNRPAPSQRVFEAIRSARPTRLYIAGDGPREGRPSDPEQIRQCREVTEMVDWPCTVQRLYQENNLGCRLGCATAITWFFEHEEQGIILEDDCLPEPSFFGYCRELLERYRNEARVMMISGDNFQYGRERGEGSYYFSRFTHIWGWASWRRAWRHYDIAMSRLPDYLKHNRIVEILGDEQARQYWLSHFVSCYNGEIDTWDYQWTFSLWERDGLVVLPNVNLVTNIGFGPDAVHCQDADSRLANMPVSPIGELRHPSCIMSDRDADTFTFDHIFLGKPIASRDASPPETSRSERKGAQEMIEAPSPFSTDQGQNNDPDSPAGLKSRALTLLQGGGVQQAFDLLIKAKQQKAPVEGIDFLRAHCFLKMGQPLGAVEALREELRFFPGSREAAQMLDDLQRQIPAGAYGTCGTDNPEFRDLLAAIRPFTMLSEQRLYNLYLQARTVCENDLPGNFVECGVAAGGSSALLAYVIKKYSRQPRRLFSFDSFCGMPMPGEHDSHQGLAAESTGWGTGTCAAPEESLRKVCDSLGVFDLVTPVKGYFEETLPRMRDWVGMVALLHLDGDWYSSTKAILENLYDRLLHGAVLQVDDYGYWDGCRRAIHEFETARSLSFAINEIDGTGVWFTKPDRFPMNGSVPTELVDDFHRDDPVLKGVASQMSANERFQLYYALRRIVPQGPGLLRFIEIGSYSGASLLLTHQALMRRKVRFQGICVEPGGTDQFHQIVKLLSDDIIHLPLFSHDASQRLAQMVDQERLPQFIFVDGDHTYQGVRQDILDFYPLLAKGGIMLFHDYLPTLNQENGPFILHHHGNQEPGIRQACQELMEETYHCELVELPLLYPTDPTQTQAQLPIIPGVFSTVRAYRKPA